MLATLNLIGLGSDNTPNAEYDRWAIASASFVGAARSVTFTGAADFIAFDDVTIGSTVPEDCVCPRSSRSSKRTSRFHSKWRSNATQRVSIVARAQGRLQTSPAFISRTKGRSRLSCCLNPRTPLSNNASNKCSRCFARNCDALIRLLLLTRFPRAEQ